MNTYEALIIFKPILDVENVDAILNQFQKNVVEANQGKIVDIDRIGRKRLAYEIKKFKDGFLTLYILELPPEKVTDFKRACQLNDDVLRITLVRRDPRHIKEFSRERTSPQAAEATAPAGRRPRGPQREPSPVNE